MSTHLDVVKETQKQTTFQEPFFYRVVMMNDDYTPMDFVVHILKTIFRKSEQDALQLMMVVHKAGKAIVGRYTFEIAETKVKQVHNRARQFEYPLLCVTEIDQE